MASHKSALKRARQNEDRRQRNRMNKTRLKNATKAVRQSVAEKSPESARTQLREAESVIAKASKKGTIHKRTAARKISRLARLVNSLQSQ